MGLNQFDKNSKILILQLCTAIDAMYLGSSVSIDNAIINICIKLSRLVKLKAVDIFKVAESLKKQKLLNPSKLEQEIMNFKSKSKFAKYNKKAKFAKAPLVLHTRSIDDISDYPYPHCQKQLNVAICSILDALEKLNLEIEKYGKIAKSEMYLELQDLAIEVN